MSLPKPSGYAHDAESEMQAWQSSATAIYNDFTEYWYRVASKRWTRDEQEEWQCWTQRATQSLEQNLASGFAYWLDRDWQEGRQLCLPYQVCLAIFRAEWGRLINEGK